MKIAVRAKKGPSFTLWLPVWLLRPKLLQWGLSYSRPAIRLEISPEICRHLRRTIKAYRRLKIVSVRSADGDSVDITL